MNRFLTETEWLHSLALRGLAHRLQTKRRVTGAGKVFRYGMADILRKVKEKEY